MHVKLGLYRHYKGNMYQVIGVARHTESGEALVVYQALYGSYTLWVRPLAMFVEKVHDEGVVVDRFTYLDTPLEHPFLQENG